MLETTWFILWGVLWAVYFVLDGFDLGLGTLLPFISRDDTDRRMIYNSMGPFWDGNEVWLITAGGVTFAAFPTTYAVMFSALYAPLMLILFALIVRGVSFEFRNKIDSPGWRKLWDTCLFIGSAVPAILFGVAFANIFQGIPIVKDGIYQGNLIGLLNPYGLLGGLLFLLLFLVHGCLWLTIKTSGRLSDDAEALAHRLWPFLLLTAVVFLIATYFFTPLWQNYLDMPVLLLLPLLAVAGLLMSRFLPVGWKAWAGSALTIASATLFGVAGLYPNLLPSNIAPQFSLSIHNSASSPLTLKIMLGVALVFVPIVIVYQSVVYHFFRHKLTPDDLLY